MLSASRPCVRLGRVTWQAVCVVCGRASVRARTPLARTKGGPPPASRCAGGLPGDVSAPVTLGFTDPGQAQVDRLPRCRPVLPPEWPRGLPAVPCRIPAPSQSHLFTIRHPQDSEVTDRHRQRRSLPFGLCLRTRLALRLGVPPGPGHPVCRGPHSAVGAALPASASSVYATRSSGACHLRGAAEVEEATPVGLCLSPG